MLKRMNADAERVRASVRHGLAANYRRRLTETATSHRKSVMHDELETSAMLSATLSFAAEQMYLCLALGFDEEEKIERIGRGVKGIHQMVMDQLQSLVHEVGGSAFQVTHMEN